MTPKRFRRAFSMAEAAVSVVIVGVVLAAALSTVGASGRARQKTVDRARGAPLAQDLMTEILAQAYKEPGGGLGTLGPDIGETVGGDRSRFDDIDDYDGWSASPPETRDGTPIDGFDHWQRRVEVVYVDADDLSQEVGSDTGIKRITVTAAHNDVPVAILVAIRTSAGPHLSGESAGGDPGNDPPSAVATAVPDKGAPPLTVSLFAGGSSDPNGDPLTYKWDFGDGGTGSGVLVMHTFAEGSYTATLIVSDGRGGVDTDTVGIDAESD